MGDRIIDEHDESEPDSDEEPETTLLALGGTPGKAYDPDGWELWAPLNPLYEAGEYAGEPCAADRRSVSQGVS